MSDKELIEQIKVMADKLVYAMDNGLEEIEANNIISLCKQHFKQEAIKAIEKIELDVSFNGNIMYQYSFADVKRLTIKAIEDMK